MNKRSVFLFGLTLFAVAFALRAVVALKQGISHPMESDSYYYLELAKSLSHGTGYTIHDSFWPDQPTMQRMPAWPFLVSLGLRLLPSVSPDLLMRLMCMILDSLNAVLVGWLTWMLMGSVRKSVRDNKVSGARVATAVPGGTACEDAAETAATTADARGRYNYILSLIAGLLYAIHPAALFLVYNGESEPLFVTLCLTGYILLLRGGRWIYPASFCFGLSCLIRANYVIWIGVFAVLVLIRWLFCRNAKREAPVVTAVPGGMRTRVPNLFSIVLLSTLFLLPSLFWATRNYHVCGHFPVLSTLRGQTFYGGNNPVVANTLDMWGYWIFPDSIPGEKRAVDLARTKSEYELDVYYYNKGKAYVRTEWFSMPRLLLGKFVRAYIPIPWKPNIMSYGVGVYRALIYLLAIVGLIWWWSGQNKAQSPCSDRRLGGTADKMPSETLPIPIFSLVFFAMLITNIAGVLIFWGCFRFTFVLEPLMLPFAVITLGLVFRKCSATSSAE